MNIDTVFLVASIMLLVSTYVMAIGALTHALTQLLLSEPTLTAIVIGSEILNALVSLCICIQRKITVKF